MPMMIKFLLICLLLASVIALAFALTSLANPKDKRDLAKRLSWRMGLSVSAFVILMVAFFMGWIHPHPLGH